MTATEKRLQEMTRIRDTLLAALRGTALSSIWFEVWKCSDQLKMPEERAYEILDDWLRSGGTEAIDRLVNMLGRGE